jgi:hypothetical protein
MEPTMIVSINPVTATCKTASFQLSFYGLGAHIKRWGFSSF